MSKGCAYCGRGRDKRHGGKQWFLAGYVPTKEVFKVCSEEHFLKLHEAYMRSCMILGNNA